MQSAKLAENEKADASIFFDFQGGGLENNYNWIRIPWHFSLNLPLGDQLPFDIRIIIQEIYNGPNLH